MDAKDAVRVGNVAAKMFKTAWHLNRQLEDFVVQQLGYADVEDYMAKTGLSFENDVLIDAIQHEGEFTKKSLLMAIENQRLYIRNHGAVK